MVGLEQAGMTRRAALAALAIAAAAAAPGCNPEMAKHAAVAAWQMLIKLPWDKVTSVAVNLITGTLAVVGFVNGQEVKAEIKLTDEQIKQLQQGAAVKAELKGGKSETVTPQVKK